MLSHYKREKQGLLIMFLDMKRNNCSYNIFILGDIIVGLEQKRQGHFIWGNVIIMLGFLPNIVFFVWFVIANKSKLRYKSTWTKIMMAGMVQVITFLRYIHIIIKSNHDMSLRYIGLATNTFVIIFQFSFIIHLCR